MRPVLGFLLLVCLSVLLLNIVNATDPRSVNEQQQKNNNNDPFHLHFPHFAAPSNAFHSLQNDFQSMNNNIQKQIHEMEARIKAHKQAMDKHFQTVFGEVNVNNPLLIDQLKSIQNNPVTTESGPSIPSSSSVPATPTAAGPLSAGQSSTTSISLSKVDLIEKDDKYLINAEMTGIPKENINIHIDNGLLTLEGRQEINKEQGGDNEKYHYRERSYSSVKRSLRIPSDVDPSTISARYENGLLSIDLPKKPDAIKPPLKVPIQ